MIYYYECPPNLTVSSYVAVVARVLEFGWLSSVAALLRYCAFVIGVASFVGVSLVDETWKRWFLAAASMTLCSNFSGYYTMLYFVPAIYSYICSERAFTTIDWLYIFVFVLLLTPLQLGNFYVCNSSVNPFVSGCLIFAGAVVILMELLVKRLSVVLSNECTKRSI